MKRAVRRHDPYVPSKTEAFWQAYLASLPHAEDAIRRFYEVFRIGNTASGADAGAALVVETIAVDVKGFDEVDAAFAYDYGEWDRTLETWRARCWELNAPRCHALGKAPTPEMPLVCERFVVVYP